MSAMTTKFFKQEVRRMVLDYLKEHVFYLVTVEGGVAADGTLDDEGVIDFTVGKACLVDRIVTDEDWLFPLDTDIHLCAGQSIKVSLITWGG